MLLAVCARAIQCQFVAFDHKLWRSKQRNVTRTCVNVIDPPAMLATEVMVMAVGKLESRVFSGQFNHLKVLLGNECLEGSVDSRQT